jgi:hypothetical protein
MLIDCQARSPAENPRVLSIVGVEIATAIAVLARTAKATWKNRSPDHLSMTGAWLRRRDSNPRPGG